MKDATESYLKDLSKEWSKEWNYILLKNTEIKKSLEKINLNQLRPEDTNYLTFILLATLCHGVNPKGFCLDICAILKEEDYIDALLWMLKMAEEKREEDAPVLARIFMALAYVDGDRFLERFYMFHNKNIVGFLIYALVAVSEGVPNDAVEILISVLESDESKKKSLDVIKEFA